MFNVDDFVFFVLGYRWVHLPALSFKQPISKYYPQTRQSRAFDESIVYSGALVSAESFFRCDSTSAGDIPVFCRISSFTISRLISPFQFSTFQTYISLFASIPSLAKINQRQARSKSAHFSNPHLNRCRMFASVSHNFSSV